MDSSNAGGSHKESLMRVISQDYRRKCEVAEAAYEAKRKKELGLLECKELEFLMIDPFSLSPEKTAYIRRKQDEIMKKISKSLICLSVSEFFESCFLGLVEIALSLSF
ncbi:hypothetical protein Tco_1456327 [Tanacetum coccineum]